MSSAAAGDSIVNAGTSRRCYQLKYSVPNSLLIMATSSSPSHNENRLETARLLASKCDPIPWEASTTYYTRLWKTKFRLIQKEFITDNDLEDLAHTINEGKIDKKFVDTVMQVTWEQCIKRDYWYDYSTTRKTRLRGSAMKDKEVKSTLGSARLASESVYIPDAWTVLDCVVERVRILITRVLANNTRAYPVRLGT
jgi:hypothetical protein